jgi:hypothetical protein
VIDLLGDEDEGGHHTHVPVLPAHLAAPSGSRELQQILQPADRGKQQGPALAVVDHIEMAEERPGLQGHGAAAVSSPGSVSLGEVDVAEQRRILHDLQLKRLMGLGSSGQQNNSSRAPGGQGQGQEASRGSGKQSSRAGSGGRGRGGKEKGGAPGRGQLSITSLLSTKAQQLQRRTQ